MKWKDRNLQARLYLIGTVILLIGLSSALVIYLTAEDISESGVGYEIADGNVYQVTPENSKSYTHDLELFGGTSAVLANELRLWFVGLWQGKSLAFTVGCISILISLGFFYVAYHSPNDLKSHGRGENGPEGPDQ